MATILVTGCAGFIGSNFVNIYTKRFPKDSVIGIDDLSTGKKENLNSKIVFYEGSILDTKLLNKISKKHQFEYIIHFAALPSVFYSVENPFLTSQINTLGTINLLELSRKRKVKRFIFSSSAAVYGNTTTVPIKEKTASKKPLSPYSLQKLSSEQFCQLFSKLYNLETICLRYFNVYGPGQHGNSAYSTVVSAWLEALYFPKNKKAFIEGNGQQTRDFCYVNDVVNANILALKSKNKFCGEAVNIASGRKTTIIEIKNVIEKLTGLKLDLEKRPARSGDIKHSLADIKLAKKLINFRAQTQLNYGLKETIKWFIKRT